MAREPSTPFDYDALDESVEELRELRAFREQIESRSIRTLEIVTDFLFSGRSSQREIVARWVAFGIATRHPKFAGKSHRALAAKFELSPSAIDRIVNRVVPELRRLATFPENEK